MQKRVWVSLLFAVVLPASVLGQQSIFVVRHAERADAGSASASAMDADPDLSEPGRIRAQHLAAMLRDAGITAIYVTQFKRSQQTAEPLARAAGVTPTQVPSTDVQALVEKLKTRKGNVLVVGHSNTVPEILKALGMTTQVTIGDAEYDHLFIVVSENEPRLIHLHYQ